MDDEIPEIPFVRGEFLNKVTRISYYIQTRGLIAVLNERIKELETELNDVDIEKKGWSKSAIDKAHEISRDKHHRISIMQKQKERLSDRLTEMESQIKIDMDSEK